MYHGRNNVKTGDMDILFVYFPSFWYDVYYFQIWIKKNHI